MSAAKQVSSRLSASVASAAAAAASEALATNAPKSVLSIPTMVRYGPIPLSELAREKGRVPGAAVLQLGSTRRIFVLQPNLTQEEMDGLAYRIQMLMKNTSLNSILLANHLEKTDSNKFEILPISALELDQDSEDTALFGDEFDIGAQSQQEGSHEWLVGCGYDARKVLGMDKRSREKLLSSMMRLSRAVKGSTASNLEPEKDQYVSKIPFISVPHGLLSDGGYALAMGSYVLATSESRFRIMNPLRGLSLDPIGLSYVLPRLGWEFQQPSASYPVGSVLALTGFEADASDMVETGLATHFMDSVGKLGSLERALASLAPYDQQRLIKEPAKRYGDSVQNRFKTDINARYRNVAIAGLMHSVSAYDAMGQELTSPRDEVEALAQEDPSLVLEADRAQFLGDRSSTLLNVAVTFKDVFESESSLEGIVERMREYAAADAKNEEEIEFVNLAKDILNGMEAQSPLALSATYKLMQVGKNANESLESCMNRERSVLLKLFDKEDFRNWAKSGAKEGEFKGWTHKGIKEVTSDEVEELFR
jgi:enoyl-CoA hydratase/carnithine racemase